MQTENGSCEKAWPVSMGCASQEEEQEDGGAGVEENAGEMVPSGMHAKELAIEHVGEQCERVPITGSDGFERPQDISQPRLNRWIIGHIFGIIVTHKAIFQGRRECRKHGDAKNQAGPKR